MNRHTTIVSHWFLGLPGDQKERRKKCYVAIAYTHTYPTLFPVNLIQTIPSSRIHLFSRRLIPTLAYFQMPQELYQCSAVFEAPLADIQPVDCSSDKFFGVEGRVPRLDEKIAEADFEDVGVNGTLRFRFGRLGRGACAVGDCWDDRLGHWEGMVLRCRWAGKTDVR